jgi:hypothetical protein
VRSPPRRSDPRPSPIQVPEHELYGEVGASWQESRWQPIRRRIERARYYWIAVATPGGLVRTAPVWAIWHDNELYALIGLSTMIGRSLVANERATAHLESARRVIIVEGRMRRVDAGAVPVAVVDAYEEKYGDRVEADDPWIETIPWFRLSPAVARTWDSRDIRATGSRWTFQ